MSDFIKDVRILICDDHAIVRSGLAKLLAEENWIYSVGEAENGEDMVRKYELFRPDLVLADISMPRMSGIEAVKIIMSKYPNAKILFLSMLFDDQYIYCAIKVGAAGLISKNISRDELIYAIKEVSLGRQYFGPLYDYKKIREIIKKYDGNDNLSFNIAYIKMTCREEEIVNYISQGLTSDEIAEKLNLGKRTVDKIRSNVMQKFDLKTLPALISFAIHYIEDKKNSNTTIDI
jgi:two-component system response regulator NreC